MQHECAPLKPIVIYPKGIYSVFGRFWVYIVFGIYSLFEILEGVYIVESQKDYIYPNKKTIYTWGIYSHEGYI